MVDLEGRRGKEKQFIILARKAFRQEEKDTD